MSKLSSDPYRHKKITGVFIIALATASTLAYNALLIYHDRSDPYEIRTGALISSNTLTPNTPTFTLEEVAKHTSAEDCWMAAYGNVYDVTTYVSVNTHPGGQGSLLSGCGKEVTATFDRIHSSRATELFEVYKIGILELN